MVNGLLSPHVNVQFGAAVVTSEDVGQTDSTFIPVIAERGPLTPQAVSSPAAYELLFGGRHSGFEASFDHVAALTAGSGGRRVMVVRVVGPGAKTASLAMQDADSGESATISATSPGAWGNRLSVTVLAGAGDEQTVLIQDRDTVVHRWTVKTLDELAALSERSPLVRVTVKANGQKKAKVVVKTNLTAGADDDRAITLEHVEAALAQLDQSYGPGQVLAPLWTSEHAHRMLIKHAAANNRVALLDVPRATKADTATLSAWVQAREAVSQSYVDGVDVAWRAALFPVWVGMVPWGRGGTIARDVPGSVFAAAVIARNSRNIQPNEQPIAANGHPVPGVFTEPVIPVSAQQRDHITNQIRANVPFHEDRDGIRLYGFVSVSSQVPWRQFNRGRFAMALADEIGDRGEAYIGLARSEKNRALLKSETEALLEMHVKTGNLTDYRVSVADVASPHGVPGWQTNVAAQFGESTEFIVFNVTNRSN